jgi:hypothetical protein
MLISIHKEATTMPMIRAVIQASTKPARMAAERYGISEQTVWKWRSLDEVHDRSHTPPKLQTTLTPPQQAVAVAIPGTKGIYRIGCGSPGVRCVFQSHAQSLIQTADADCLCNVVGPRRRDASGRAEPTHGEP